MVHPQTTFDIEQVSFPGDAFSAHDQGFSVNFIIKIGTVKIAPHVEIKIMAWGKLILGFSFTDPENGRCETYFPGWNPIRIETVPKKTIAPEKTAFLFATLLQCETSVRCRLVMP